MTVNLSIKNVPDDMADMLRRRAETNHRSLQGELMALLESTLGPAQLARDPVAHYAADAPSRPAVATTVATLQDERPTLRTILRQARAADRADGPSSVELLREARAERDEQLAKLLDAPDAYERARALLLATGAGSRKAAAKSAVPRQSRRGTARTDKRG